MKMRQLALAVLCLLPATAWAQDCNRGVQVVNDLGSTYKHPQLDFDKLTVDGDGQVVAAERWKRSEDTNDHEVSAELRKGWIRER